MTGQGPERKPRIRIISSDTKEPIGRASSTQLLLCYT